jgi:ribosome recycling factor
MLEDIYKDAEHRMDQAVVHTNMELVKVRTGRANPEIFDTLMVDYYGTMTPLNQLANISVPEVRLITIQPYEKTLIPQIEKMILENNLGLTPSNNGTVVHVPIPPLSEERRRELIKYVHELTENGKISIRNVRRDAIHHIKDAKDEEHISEDIIMRSEKEIQELTDKHIQELDDLLKSKEEEILEV